MLILSYSDKLVGQIKTAMFKTLGFNKSMVAIDTDESIVTFSQA